MDGWDECAKEFRAVVEGFIRDVLRGRVSLIVTSRPAAVNSFFDDFTNVYELSPLDDAMKDHVVRRDLTRSDGI